MLDKLFDRFIQEKTYIQNCSQKTISYFRQSFKAYKKQAPERADSLRVIQFSVRK